MKSVYWVITNFFYKSNNTEHKRTETIRILPLKCCFITFVLCVCVCMYLYVPGVGVKCISYCGATFSKAGETLYKL